MNEVKRLKQQTKLIRKTRYYKSKLDTHRAELLAMHKQSATIAELQRFLQAKRIKVNYSTVYRYVYRYIKS